ncbi:MAG: TonB-dependent receptor [Pseudomonadota bacterium]
MIKTPLAGRFMRTTMLTSVAVAMAAPAFAQDDDTIIVTGSRIQNANLNSSSPVFQVDASEIDARGVTRVEDLINVLPQAFAAQTSDVANGATGTSTVNLRGLGAVRTLVLMDGKRLPYGSPAANGGTAAIATNIDIIPTQLVERVDVVTGGQSAVYGSDAVAGVVNFVMRRDFEGFAFDGQVGFYQDGNGNEFAQAVTTAAQQPTVTDGVLDGRDVLASAMFGANTADGRGNVTAFISYQNQNGVAQTTRDHSACAWGPTGASPLSVGGVGCVGSGNFRTDFTNGLHLSETGTFVPFVGGPSQTYNFGPLNNFLRPNERFNIFATARYEITDNIEAYLDATFMNNRTSAQIAESALFVTSSVNCDNPFIQTPVNDPVGNPGVSTWAEAIGCSAAQIATGLNPDGSNADVGINYRHRNVEGSPRISTIDNSVWRLSGGFRGTIGENWNWDTYGQFARVTEDAISQNDLNFSRIQDALFAVDDGTGNIVCRSGNAGCAPWNIFSRNADGTSGVSQAAVNYVQGTGIVIGTTEQVLLGGNIVGDLAPYGFQFPWADNGVQGVFGVEWRRDTLDRLPDDVSQIPSGRGFTGSGGGTLPVNGEVSVWELYMETQIPLIENKPFFEEFGINGAYRYSNYSTDGNGVQNSFDTHTFSAGVTWTPIQDIRLRGQFQRAVRAPNVFNLFTGQNTGLFNAAPGPNGLVDPCAGDFSATTTAIPAPQATAAQCAFTGVTAAQYGTIQDNPAQQLNSVTGGNPFLTPEKSDTYTFGAVFTPSFLPGFNLAVDYFDITINDAISAVPPQTSLNQCIATGEAQFCDLIIRDQFGSLWLDNTNFEGVQATSVNLSNIATRGIDVAAAYTMDMADLGVGDLGSMNFNYVSTFLMELSSIPVPGVTSVTECKGLYRGSCGGPNGNNTVNPEYRHRLLTTWQTPWNIDVTATWRYSSSVTLDSGSPSLSQGGTAVPSGTVTDDQLDSASYLDLAAQFYVRENVTLRTGVNNVFGRDPELTTAAGTAPGNGNTFPGVYDALGRFIFFGVNIEL